MMQKQQKMVEIERRSEFPAVRPLNAKRFNIDNEDERKLFLEHLENEGYAVVGSVADPAQVEHAKDLFWNFLEGKDNGKVNSYQVQREDPTTWETTHGWLGNVQTGIISGSGVGQASFMWYLRMLPGVREAFASIWNTNANDLLCSMNGANVFRPWRYKSEWRTRGGWLHLDQNAYNPGKDRRCCVQGLVTLTKVDEHSGGLTIIPRSHREFLSICERNAEKPSDINGMTKVLRDKAETSSTPFMDYVPIKEQDEIRRKGQCLICAEPGDLIVWDSRTVHCNSPALLSHQDNDCDSFSKEHGWELLRMAVYICMTPASWAKERDLHKRWEAFVNNVSTTHWPHYFVGGERCPYDMPKNDPSALTQTQCRLIGGWVDPPEAVVTRLEQTKDQLEALKLLELAEKAEGCGDYFGAISFYKKAYKLDPTLEFPD